MSDRLTYTVPLSGLAKSRRARVSLRKITALAEDEKYSAADPAPSNAGPHDPTLRTLLKPKRHKGLDAQAREGAGVAAGEFLARRTTIRR